MKLSEKRVLFTKLLGEFLVWCAENKHYVAIDEAKRSQAQADSNAKSGAGISNSLHLIPLAVDLVLYLDDPKTPDIIEHDYASRSESYKVLGEKWKTLHPLCRWGGDFKSRPDGNHFSLEHNGVR